MPAEPGRCFANRPALKSLNRYGQFGRFLESMKHQFSRLLSAVVGVSAVVCSSVNLRSAEEKDEAEAVRQKTFAAGANSTASGKIRFSGQEWKVKASREKRVGPGNNLFGADSVFLDEQHRLHLKVTQRSNRWYCAEVISEQSFGFGTYRFYLSTPLEKLDPNLTLGLFTWSDARDYAHREIDVECAKWGKADDTNNAQFVVQPYQPVGHLVRFRVPPEMEATTHIFNWQSNRVVFRCLAGHAREPSADSPIIKEWTFQKKGVPQPGDENARINLWLATKTPRDSNDTEVIVAKFEFEPAEGSSQEPEVVIASLPPASLQPGPEGAGKISGVVRGSDLSDCKVIVYAFGDKWYVQPLAVAPDTTIIGGKWSTMTRGGTEYAVLLVKSSYKARPTLVVLPDVEGDVLAVARKKPQ